MLLLSDASLVIFLKFLRDFTLDKHTCIHYCDADHNADPLQEQKEKKQENEEQQLIFENDGKSIFRL